MYFQILVFSSRKNCETQYEKKMDVAQSKKTQGVDVGEQKV